jgi:Ca-activated chloride channel family protein
LDDFLNQMYIHCDGLKLILVSLLFFFALWLFLRVRKKESALGFATPFRFEKRLTIKLCAYYVGAVSFWMAAALLLFALTNPRLAREAAREKISKKGIAIWLLLDMSSSMKDPFGAGVTKVDVLKDMCRRVIHDRPNDVIGIMTFARRVDFLCPLSNDRRELLARTDAIHPVTDESEDGTAIGYALFRAVNLIVSVNHFAERLKEERKPSYVIENQIIILMTDGLQCPNPLDRDHPFRFMGPANALSFASQNHIRVYFIGLVPAQEQAAFLQQDADVVDGVQKTGGGFSLVSDDSALRNTFAEIDRIEKSRYTTEKTAPLEASLVPLIVMWSLAFLALGVVSETLFARRLP